MEVSLWLRGVWPGTWWGEDERQLNWGFSVRSRWRSYTQAVNLLPLTHMWHLMFAECRWGWGDVWTCVSKISVSLTLWSTKPSTRASTSRTTPAITTMNHSWWTSSWSPSCPSACSRVSPPPPAGGAKLGGSGGRHYKDLIGVMLRKSNTVFVDFNP